MNELVIDKQCSELKYCYYKEHSALFTHCYMVSNLRRYSNEY